MDRRAWFQLLGLLSTAASASPQQSQAQQPLRVKKGQVRGPHALMGLEFQDAELQVLLRRGRAMLRSYENYHMRDRPYQPAPTYPCPPGPPGPQPVKVRQRY